MASKSLEHVQFLVDKLGANLNGETSKTNPWIPLWPLSYSVKPVDSTPPLLLAVSHSQADIAKFLIERGAEKKVVGAKTLLMHAVNSNSLETVQMLLNYVDVNEVNASGWSKIKRFLLVVFIYFRCFALCSSWFI